MRNIFIFILLLIFTTQSNAQSGGDGVFAFLKLTNSAQVAALGGINVSLPDSVSNSDFAFHNPALLSEASDKQISMNYVNYFTDINFGYASYSFYKENAGTFSVGIHYVNYGDFTGADANGVLTGEFTASDYALNLIWSKKIRKNLYAGVNLKPIYSHLETYNSVAAAADLGLSYRQAKKGLNLGITFKNIGYQIKPYYTGHYENLPFDIEAGISKRLAHAPFRVHLTAHHLYEWDLRYETGEENTTFVFGESDPEDGQDFQNFLDNGLRHLIIGVDFLPVKNFYASISYNHLRKQELSISDTPGMVGFSFGFGLKLKKMSFGYGRQTYHLAGASNLFSFALNLQEFSKYQK